MYKTRTIQSNLLLTSSKQLYSGAISNTFEYLGSIGNADIFFPSTVNFEFASLSMAPENTYNIVNFMRFETLTLTFHVMLCTN